MDNCMVLSIPIETLNSPFWIRLSHSAKAMFLDAAAQLSSVQNGQLDLTFKHLEMARNWRDGAARIAISELVTEGYLKKTTGRGSERNARYAISLFREFAQ